MSNFFKNGCFQITTCNNKKYCWDGKLWAQSCLDETIGNANEEVICANVQTSSQR
ncbi:MAG: hypothetical protein ACJAYF_003489 [Arenicella sp.]